MKGVKKCYGPLLVLFTMLGLSLNVSLDVNATSYSLDGIMMHSFLFPVSENGAVSQTDLSVTLTDINLIDKPRNSSYIQASFDSSKDNCVFYSYNNPGYFISGNNITWQGSFVPPFVSIPSDNFKCDSMKAFGEDPIPEFDKSSVPFDKEINTSSMLPYHYMYNTIPFSSVRIRDGVEYPSQFDLSELLQNGKSPNESGYTYYSDIITEVRMPINFDSSLDDLSSHSSLQLAGTILFPDGISDSDFTDLSVSFHGGFVRNNGFETIFSSDPICYLTPQNANFSRLNFLCKGSVKTFIPASSYSLDIFIKDSSNNGFSSTKQPIHFSDFILTTNDEPTYPFENGSITGNGSFPNVAPGVADLTNNQFDNNADWFSSLSNMFNFNFTNPFSPIFALFSDNESCAQIPTISSMIHSVDTQVCPFFPSDVRRLLTPVFGLSSSMLIFGFAIRWLGSSSGNFFDDSSGETLTYSNWYDGGRGFKRTSGSPNRRINK